MDGKGGVRVPKLWTEAGIVWQRQLPWVLSCCVRRAGNDMWLSDPIRKWLANRFGNQFQSNPYLRPDEAS